jgi:osmotically-inducible protein OsmY
MKTDSQLQADVLEELRHDAAVATNGIGVATADGVVTLAGEVDSVAKLMAVRRAAERVRGVRAVADEMVVRLPSDHRQTDADLAHAVVSALMWDTDVPDKTIKARVRDGCVWLVGEADWQYQCVAAERAVEHIIGVKHVTNLVRVKRQIASPTLKPEIEQAIGRQVALQGRTIVVSVDESRVMLSGEVRSWRERMDAEHAAWSAPGVTDVDNRIEVHDKY